MTSKNDNGVSVAEDKDVPMPDVLVPLVTGMSLVTNRGILLWKFPRASAGALIVFSLGTNPLSTISGQWKGKQRHGNKINFLNNIALLGGTILLTDGGGRCTLGVARKPVRGGHGHGQRGVGLPDCHRQYPWQSGELVIDGGGWDGVSREHRRESVHIGALTEQLPAAAATASPPR